MKIDGTRRQDRAVELVLGYYAAFNRGDREAMLALLADDVVHDLNQGARETGKAAFAAFMQRMDHSYREQLHDIIVLASQDGGRAAAEYVVHGEYLQADAGLVQGVLDQLPDQPPLVVLLGLLAQPGPVHVKPLLAHCHCPFSLEMECLHDIIEGRSSFL